MRSIPHTTSANQLRRELSARFSRPLMTFFLRRIKDRSQAEDLTKEVLSRVVRVCESGQIERAESYVFRVATNLLRDRRCRVRRSGPPIFAPVDEALEREVESPVVEALSPACALRSQESLVDVLSALNELSALTRNVFILFRLENMTHKDIAALYGMGESTVEKHVMKAVLHLATRRGRKR
jgi:RNA polymerase sigma-70 factor (ECF subfamily)